MLIFKNFKLSKECVKNSVSEIVSTIKDQNVFVEFQFSDSFLYAIFVLEPTNNIYYSIIFDKKIDNEQVAKFTKGILEKCNTIIISSYEEFLNKFLDHHNSFPVDNYKNKVVDVRTLYYLLGFLSSKCNFSYNIDNYIDSFGIDGIQYEAIKNQIDNFKNTRYSKKNLNKLIPLSVNLEFNYQILLLIKEIYNKTSNRFNKKIHDEVYIPLYSNLRNIKRTGIKFNLSELKKQKFSSVNIESFFNKFEQIIDKNWKLYPSYNLTSTSTGRISSKGKINYCAIPNEIKKFIIPHYSGDKLIYVDYNAIDYRSAISVANPDISLDFDVHNMVCKELFGEINKKNRDKSKLIVFQTLYTNDRNVLYNRLNINDHDLSKLDNLIGIKSVIEYLDNNYEKVKEVMQVENYIGCIRKFQHANDIKKSHVSNFLVQPISNILSFLALNEISMYFKKLGSYDNILLFEHDGMYLNLSGKLSTDFEERVSTIKKIMQEEVPEKLFGRRLKFKVRVKEMEK